MRPGIEGMNFLKLDLQPPLKELGLITPPVYEAILTLRGLDWTTEKIEVLKDCFLVWERKDEPLFLFRVTYLLGKFQSFDAFQFVDSAKLVLLQTGQDPLYFEPFSRDLLKLMNEILSG